MSAVLPQPPFPVQTAAAADDGVDELSPTTSSAPPRMRSRESRDGPKKKKASRACAHCQKAHLTCDDSRPCQRCIKRGTADTCTEGHRKKAKYLLDDEEIAQLKGSGREASSVPDTVAEPPPPPTPSAPQQPQPPFEPQTEQVFTPVPFDPSFPFGSEAANLEYSILSAILGNPSPPDSTSTPSAPGYTPWPSEDPMEPRAAVEFSATFSDQQMAVQPSETTMSTSPTTSYLTYTYPPPPAEQQDAVQYPPQFQQPPSGELHPLQPRFPLDGRPRSPPYPERSPRAIGASFSVPSGSQLQNINDRVTMPYDYTEGYHFLMKHLPSRFEKNDILRVVRALAIFRPSLIALQMPLSFDDEVFVEKCFQRTLLELDKLISFSGTPTVVWRRTGEICLAAPEFCMLTEWTMDELVGRKKYIYELFENQSVVEYWENFASHAFENTTQSVYSHCVLLKPTGAPVPCTFCFSIRRDLFDLPSVVIGQWLPLL
uniref:Transcription activator of gluconeogenesis ERT1 n=1 Tax=Mycena chlorophos TaxID=658473 RepID=A0ABQ0L0I7_MYCCL|nr:transcriptional factor [Mycena chlorophos]